MATCKHRLPGFRATLVTIGALEVVLGASILLRGIAPSMAEFAVPEALLAAAHYRDAILWVYVHMIVLGLVIGLLGLLGEGAPLRRWLVRLLFAAHLVYLYLDLRSSDSALGDGLYQGPGSLIPALLGGLFTALFLHLCLCPAARGEAPTRAPRAAGG